MCLEHAKAHAKVGGAALAVPESTDTAGGGGLMASEDQEGPVQSIGGGTCNSEDRWLAGWGRGHSQVSCGHVPVGRGHVQPVSICELFQYRSRVYRPKHDGPSYRASDHSFMDK